MALGRPKVELVLSAEEHAQVRISSVASLAARVVELAEPVFLSLGSVSLRLESS